MKYNGQQSSSDIDDRTSASGGGSSFGGGLSNSDLTDIFGGSYTNGMSVPSSNRGLFGGGIGTVIIMIILYFLMNGGLGSILGNSTMSNTSQNTTTTGGTGGTGDIFGDLFNQVSGTSVDVTSSAYQGRKEFVSVVLKYLEDYWSQEAQKDGFTYNNPTLVLYNGSTSTPSGLATKDMGPFYSPVDQKIYLDLSFADELSSQYGAKGDYAMAYVLAHEFGHHIQNLLGVTDKLDQASTQLNETQYNKLSVRLELQADYYAGMFTKWLGDQTYDGESILEADDVQDAVETAQSIGDDTLMENAGQYVNPDNFTHGTSAQRVAWFKAGYKYGDMTHGDTFNAPNLDKP